VVVGLVVVVDVVIVELLVIEMVEFVVVTATEVAESIKLVESKSVVSKFALGIKVVKLVVDMVILVVVLVIVVTVGVVEIVVEVFEFVIGVVIVAKDEECIKLASFSVGVDASSKVMVGVTAVELDVDKMIVDGDVVLVLAMFVAEKADDSKIEVRVMDVILVDKDAVDDSVNVKVVVFCTDSKHFILLGLYVSHSVITAIFLFASCNILLITGAIFSSK